MLSLGIVRKPLLGGSPLKLIPRDLLLKQFRFKRTAMTSTVDWKPIKTHNNPNEMNGRGNRNKNGRKGNFGRKIALGLMIAMPAIAFYLGTWQLRRLDWKTRLVAECETKLTYPPINLPRVFTEDMCEDWEYRKVKVRGHFVYEEEIFVGPRAKLGEKGYVLYTPFIRSDTGEKILVERGWISEAHVSPENRTLHHLSMPNPHRDIDLVCLVRPPKVRGKFQWAKTDQESRLWQVADIYDIARSVGCKPINFQALYDMSDHPEWKDPVSDNIENKGQPFWKFWKSSETTKSKNNTQLINYDKDDMSTQFTEWQFLKAGIPIGKKPAVDLRNNHLQYLVTWYGLSFMSTIFLVVALRKYWWKGNVVSQMQLKKDKLRHARKYS
ncbi:cytochrome oxidase assembly protein Shy1p [Monosporozyma servazzii]